MNARLTPKQITKIRGLLDALPEGPWFVNDCEGELQVWREGALGHVTRDENGEIDGWSLPGVYSPAEDLVAEWDLDGWDPGEDTDDDTKRAVAEFLALARNLMPALLAEIERLRAESAASSGETR